MINNSTTTKSEGFLNYTTTESERIDELIREIRTRERVYPDWVTKKKITQKEATRRMQCLIDILNDIYEVRYKRDDQKNQLGLFPDPQPKESTSTHRDFWKT